ncbi:MAG: hypothetical protein ABJC36_12625 [Gemmatimonadales bacterium]
MDGKRLRRAATAVAVVVALAAPRPAAAASCLPDQSVAALDQYCESLLSPVGGTAPTWTGSGMMNLRPLNSVLPRSEVEQLRTSGPAGKALLLLPAVAPLAGGPLTASERRRTRIRASRASATSGALGSTGDQVRGFATGLAAAAGDVLGGAFRWGLVICSLGLAGMTWLRFRSRLGL